MARRGASTANIAAIGEAVDAAAAVPIAAAPAAAPRGRLKPAPAPVADDDQGGGDMPTIDLLIGEDCPVVPLGTHQGLYFYLSTLRELRTLKAKEHDGRNILSLFAPRTGDLWRVFPRTNEKGRVTGWDKEGSGERLMNACAERGVWTAEGRVRGAGAHRDEDGGLVLHCGDMIQVPETDVHEIAFGATRTWAAPGLIDRMVYPAALKTPRPALMPVSTALGQQILAVLRTWSWERPEIDPLLCLGWLAGSCVCGALDWRPMIWLTGGKGTGKSTLQKLIKLLLGDGGLIQAHDVTEAWIRQTLNMRTLPVALDEIEAEADGRRVGNIVKLARLASSGGTIGRGSADHTAQDFTMRSAFLFSSILHAPLAPQDKSRIAILDLRPLADTVRVDFDLDLARDVAARVGEPLEAMLPLVKDNGEPVLRAAFYTELGRMMRRRMVDAWPRLDNSIEMFRGWLAQNGHDARGQDQFGTLLGCAYAVLYDHDPDDLDADDELGAKWAQLLAVDRAAAAEDDEPALVVQRIATTALHARGGDLPETVAMQIARVLNAGGVGEVGTDQAAVAQRKLEMSGMVVVSSALDAASKRSVRRWKGGPVPTGEGSAPLYLAVAASHQGLEQLLRDTRWQLGVWNQALSRYPGAIKADTIDGRPRRIKVQIGGRVEWAVLVPIAAFASGDAET